VGSKRRLQDTFAGSYLYYDTATNLVLRALDRTNQEKEVERGEFGGVELGKCTKQDWTESNRIVKKQRAPQWRCAGYLRERGGIRPGKGVGIAGHGETYRG
jgi:hypothetical protein